MRIVIAPDKFKGTATAGEVVEAVSRAVASVGSSSVGLSMADGGEGTLDAMGGANRHHTVTGPLGDPVEAGWRLDRDLAVIEMARASGLQLVGGAEGNDPLGASTFGTGELIGIAVESGARRIIVGVGGSATTDGGLGALRALHPPQRLRAVEITVACDVRTRFIDAAEVFAPQKGASPRQVELLRRRLDRLAQVYADEHDVDVVDLLRSGAAGGLAGGLATVGARLVDGFDVIAEELGLYDAIEAADLVITGEGFLDEQSFEGKVVGGVAEMAAAAGVPALAIVGDTWAGADGVRPPVDGLEVVSLTERFGPERSHAEVLECIGEVVIDWVSG